MNAYQRSCLDAMGIVVWQRRGKAFIEPASEAPPASAPVAADPDRDSLLESLRREVEQCTRCPLHQARTRTVFGVGAHDA